MTHPTDQERAREVAERILPCICSKNPKADVHTLHCPGNFRKAVTDALLSFSPQPSPPDEVRGLIERARTASVGLRGEEASFDDVAIAELIDQLAANVSTPPSSPVSGEGEYETTDEQFNDLWKAAGTDGVVLSHDAVRRLMRDYIRAREHDKISRDFLAVADARVAPSRPPEPAASGERVWLIYSREHNAFWRPESSGYTWDIKQAGRYTQADATSRCKVRQHDDGGPGEVMVLAPEFATRPPEGNARAMREALERIRAVLDGPHGRASDMEASAEAWSIADKALALPVDDAAKRIRAAVALTILQNWMRRAASYGGRMDGLWTFRWAGTTVTEHDCVEAAKQLGLQFTNGGFEIAALDALAQPEQGGAK